MPFKAVKVRGNGSVDAEYSLNSSGMTLQLSAGSYQSGMGSAVWSAQTFPITATANPQDFALFLNKDGTFNAMLSETGFPTAGANLLERLVWGTIPANAAVVDDATLYFLDIVGPGEEPATATGVGANYLKNLGSIPATGGIGIKGSKGV